MPFRFSLDAPLRLRKSQQRQQELLVHRIQEQITQTLRELQAVAKKIAEISLNNRDSDLACAAALHFDLVRREVLERHRAQAQSRLEKLREEQAAQFATLRKMWQRREVLESLRNREKQQYSIMESRRDQQLQDDLFLMRKYSRRSLPT
jgi:flagellar biosynthesis chaperone FliJ